MSLTIIWFDHHAEPQCEPNPEYPNGIEVDLRKGNTQPGCIADLPYPAKRCGVYLVTCERCGYSAAITTAGRTDDPRKVTVPCKLN